MPNTVNANDILKIVNNVLRTHEVTEMDIDKELSSLGVSSTMFISIVIDLEEKYNVEIPDEYLFSTEIGTVNKMIGILSKLIEERQNNEINQ